MRQVLRAVFVLLISAALSTGAGAQVVERHLPGNSTSETSSNSLATPRVPDEDSDDRALGPSLSAIVVVTGASPLPADVPRAAIILGDSPILNTRSMRRRLQRFLGRPLSKKLISDIRIAIIRQMVRSGYPFMAVLTPSQDFETGVLRLRFVEYHVESLRVTGAPLGLAQRIKNSLRVKRGDDAGPAIDAPHLAEDLEALNAYPFRSVTSNFAPGRTFGGTDITLAVESRRPFSVYGGYDNGGANPRNRGRYDLGAAIGGFPNSDMTLTYQVTGSADFWIHDGRAFALAHPEYLSHAFDVSIPIAPRERITADVDYVDTTFPGTPFGLRSQILEARVGLQGALSDLPIDPQSLRLFGTGEFGVEAKGLRKITLFYGARGLTQVANLFQAYVGWRGTLSDRVGTTALAVMAKMSPGELDDINSSRALSLYSRSRVTDAHYEYATFQVDRTAPIGWGWWLSHQLTIQISAHPLPDTEQVPLGGESGIRAFGLGDGAFDEVLISRSDIHAPTFVPKGVGRPISAVSPYGFIDAGWARSINPTISGRAIGVGGGVDFALARRLSAAVDYSRAMDDFGTTHSGDWRVNLRLQCTY